MGNTVKHLAILGSTGSVGTQTLEIVRAYPDHFNVAALAAGRNIDLFKSQVVEFAPRLISCGGTDDEISSLLEGGRRKANMDDMARDAEVDVVVTATVGDVALGPTFSAIKARKNVALANKESIVMAGRQLVEAAKKHNVELLPLDSEPNAVWQCLRGEDKTIARLILTASGGAFRDREPEDLADVTPDEALAHPTWRMGPKITVDSATLMNKAFEVIEAHWLFGVPWENIEVVIHPQSIVHSMVEFVDGSVKAHMSPPDMRVPIQYALFYPERVRNDSVETFDPAATGALTFSPLNPDQYPCFKLALEVAMRGGTWPAALCGADEMAVQLFLKRRISFVEIEVVIREALKDHRSVISPTEDDSLSASSWGKQRVLALVDG